MNRRMLFVWSLSIGAVCILIGASVSSVVNASASESGRKASSPLFAHQISQSVQRAAPRLSTAYLAKGRIAGISFAAPPTLGETFTRAVRMMQSNPREIDALFTSIERNPQVLAYLTSNGMSAEELHRYLNLIRTNPDQVAGQLERLQGQIPASRLDAPAPLGLNTTSVIGCVVTIIVLLPIVLVIAFVVVLFTLRILACMNLDQVMQQIMDQIVQGLHHPAG